MLPRALPSPSCTLGPTSWTSPAQWFWCQSDEQECGFGIKFVFFSFIFSFYFFLSSYFFIVDFSFSFSYFVWNFSFPLLFLSSWIFLFLSLAWVFFPFSCFFFFTSANNIIGIWYIENGEKKLKNEFFFFFFWLLHERNYKLPYLSFRDRQWSAPPTCSMLCNHTSPCSHPQVFWCDPPRQ